MDGSKNMIIHMIGAFTLGEFCNEHKNSFTYFDGDHYEFDYIVNGIHNFAEGQHWIVGERTF